MVDFVLCDWKTGGFNILMAILSVMSDHLVQGGAQIKS